MTGLLTSHPIQYQAPWFRALAKELDLEVFFAHQPDAKQQGEGFGASFSWDIDLLSGYKHQFLKNVAVHPGTSQFKGYDTPEIADIIRARRFDAFIVTGWHLKAYWQAIRACRRAGIPVFVRGDSQLLSPRSPLKRWSKELIYRWVLRRFDGFLVVGQRNREYLAHYGVPERKMFTVPHFIDNGWFAARAAAAKNRIPQTRERWGINGSEFVTLFVGKFIPKKRPEDLLAALATLKRKNASVAGVLVGSGELKPQLDEAVRREKLPVHFAGFQNQTELPSSYVAADALVLPSDGGETWGLAVNEAMACGLPAIVSDAVGCAPDLIEAGRTGYSFPLGDRQALAARIEQLMQLKRAGHDFSPALREKLQHYSISAAVAGTLQAIKSIAPKSRGGLS